jgi:hypothetical protein
MQIKSLALLAALATSILATPIPSVHSEDLNASVGNLRPREDGGANNNGTQGGSRSGAHGGINGGSDNGGDSGGDSDGNDGGDDGDEGENSPPDSMVDRSKLAKGPKAESRLGPNDKGNKANRDKSRNANQPKTPGYKGGQKADRARRNRDRNRNRDESKI